MPLKARPMGERVISFLERYTGTPLAVTDTHLHLLRMGPRPDADRPDPDGAVGQFLDALDIGPDLLDIRDGPYGHACPSEARP